MSESSLLVSRTWDPESQLGSKEQIELSEPTPKDRILKEREVAIALLRFLQLLFELADVGVHPSLEPVRHEETIGEGLSFSVKKYKKGRHVLKVFKQSLASGDTGKFDHDGFEALMKEAYILGSLRHENVMKMTEITWTVIGHEPLQIAPALIIERSPYGDLSKFQTSQKNVTWKMRKMLCYDVAVGLEFLHRSGVVHGDIKGENVLIFDHETRGYLAKLSDFGSAIIVGTSSSGGPDRKVRLPAYTRPWNAPEAKESLLASTIHLTDIWSLGLLIWRILMHGDPFRSFDLPLHPATRVAMIERLLAFKRNGSYLAGFVAAEGGLEFSDLSDVVLLTGIFAVTLDREPQNRSLGTVLELLNAHSGRPASRYVYIYTFVIYLSRERSSSNSRAVGQTLSNQSYYENWTLYLLKYIG